MQYSTLKTFHEKRLTQEYSDFFTKNIKISYFVQKVLLSNTFYVSRETF